MRVIVLGGTWFVGRAVCSVLREQGHEVMVVHRGHCEPEELAQVAHLHAEREHWPERQAEFAAFAPDAAVDVSALNGRAAAVLRLGAVYGERDYQHRLKFVLRRIRAGRWRMPIGSGTFLFSRVYVRDVGTAVLAALDAPHSAGQTYNVVESATPSFRLLASLIAAAADVDLELVRVPDDVLPPDLSVTGAGKRSGVQHLLASAAKARDQLGWAETDPDVALRRAAQWHLHHPPEDWDPDFTADDLALSQA